MQTLESFYFDYLSSNLSHEDRNHGIMIFGDIICINFDAVYGHLRECTLRGVDQLLYLVHKNGKGKRFIFLSEDGAIIKHSGAFQFIINCVECFNLNEDTCAVFCRENLCIPNVRVFNMNFVHYWVNGIWNTVKSAPLQQGNLEKKFAVWFNRGTFFRLQLMRHLFENYKNDSFISYQETGMVGEFSLNEYFEDDINWANNNTPVVYDKLFENRMYDFEAIVGANRKPYKHYFLEIVAEPNIIDNSWITEKTIKNLYLGKPFIMFSGPYSLKLLKENGFQTFNNWIDESYDEIINSYDRLEAIKKEIDRLASKSYVELEDIQKQMLPVLEHNRQKFVEFISPDSRIFTQ